MNEVKESKYWKWLFAYKQFEQWDLVEFNEFKRVSFRILQELDDYIKRRVYCDWDDLRRPKWNLRYVNHNKNANCSVYFDKQYIIITANETIKKWTELTIDYWDNNIDF